MARGWESKAVESQQADREPTGRASPAVTAAERAARTRRRRLELDRARVAAELANAHQPAHRAMLERALQALDQQLE